MKRFLSFLAIGLVAAALGGCTVGVDLPPVRVSSATGVELENGFTSTLVDLSDNAQFLQYQDRFQGLTSASFAVYATNDGATAQTVRVYGSQNGSLTRETVAGGATLLAVLTVPAGAQNQQFSQQLDESALTFLENALKATPPAFTVYTRTDDPDPEGLTFGALTFIPGQGEFSILSVRAVPGGETEVEFEL